MRLRLQVAFVLLAATACFGQVVDRMAAVVNKRVILESELDQATRIEFLMAGKPLDKMSEADRSGTLDRLIDRALLDQQIMHPEMLEATPEEVRQRMSELRTQLPGAANEEGWKKLLNEYGLLPQDVEESLKSQIRVLRFIDLRFRGLVRVDKNAVESYYKEKLLPQLRAQGAAAPPLAEVSDKIEKVLAEQSIDEMMARWLDTLRAQAHIERMLPASAGASHGAQP
jgi:parvulin-like peptidyl-prolyl isomerase